MTPLPHLTIFGCRLASHGQHCRAALPLTHSSNTSIGFGERIFRPIGRRPLRLLVFAFFFSV